MQIPQLLCIADYIAYMGGVDKLDWLVNKYKVKICEINWYFPLFIILIDVTVVNAHVRFCLVNDSIPLLI